MIQRTRTLTLILAAAVVAVGCEREEPQLATEHIRQVLGGAPVEPAAELAAAAGAAAVASEEGATGEAGAAEAGPRVAGSSPELNGRSLRYEAEPDGPRVLELPAGDTLVLAPAVVEYYRARGYEPAWTGYDELTPAGAGLLAAIGSVRYDGLEPERYGVGAARLLAGELSAGEVAERKLEYLGSLDLLLTESFVRAALDLGRGVLDPSAAGLEWRFDRPTPEAEELVSRLAAGEEPGQILASLRPQARHYHRLAEGLRRLEAVADRGGWPAVSEGEGGGETLRAGDRDPRVAQLRARLLAGEDEEEQRLAAAGQADPTHFDADLERALERFQHRHTLLEDGALGPKTLAALNVSLEERMATLRLNLDRWRWLPRDLGDMYLLVNVAGFELEMVQGDSVLESMDVVVGSTATRTPLFQDSLRYVVVNPYWNVPMSIARREIIPAVRRDPGYLARNRYDVLLNGRQVNASSVSAEALGSGRYQIRQRPGPWNALGDVKFMFPNDMNIYLHDSPAHHLFSQRTRAFSAGCIRVERPADLARTVFEHLSSHDGSYYDELRGGSGERWVRLDRSIPIYIVYFTAWAREDGTLHFHPDLYEHDESLEVEWDEKLAPILASAGTLARAG
jgi:L,D-transpeptidase YcbB